MAAGCSFFPDVYPVCHIARSPAGAPNVDTGTPEQVDAPPVIRWAQAVTQFGRDAPSSKSVISAEFVARTDTAIRITVADPMVYSPLDQVRLFPELDDNGEYVPTTGISFWVDGLPSDQTLAPWPQWFSVFGGFVMLRRIT